MAAVAFGARYQRCTVPCPARQSSRRPAGLSACLQARGRRCRAQLVAPPWTGCKSAGGAGNPPRRRPESAPLDSTGVWRLRIVGEIPAQDTDAGAQMWSRGRIRTCTGATRATERGEHPGRLGIGSTSGSSSQLAGKREMAGPQRTATPRTPWRGRAGPTRVGLHEPCGQSAPVHNVGYVWLPPIGSFRRSPAHADGSGVV